MPMLTEIEKKKFEVKSFENRWGLQNPNLKVQRKGTSYSVEGDSVLLGPDKIKVLLGFEGLETIKPLMEKALWIERRLTHEPLTMTVSFYDNKVSIKKNLNKCNTSQLDNLERDFFELMKKCGVPKLEKRALDYETNFVFETEETKQERKELLQHFNYLTINWIKEIEKVMQEELTTKLT